MGKFIDLTGQKFGKLTVIKFAYMKNKKTYWYCDCDCGTKDFVVSASNLKSKNTMSCGCLKYKSHNKKYNTYDLSGDYGIGYTSNDEEFYFDLEDYDKIKDYCWCVDNKGYVYAKINNSNSFFHRFILNLNRLNDIVDHEDHVTVNNRKYNLRVTSQMNNARNSLISKNNKSGITGVSFNKHANKYESYITLNRKKIRIGYYDSFMDAVLSRLKNEEEYYEDFMPSDNRKILEYINNGGKLEYGDKKLIQEIINN